MALIKCQECGAEISDAAVSCPKCGAPVVKQVVCPECGKLVSGLASVCPNCGAPLQPQQPIVAVPPTFSATTQQVPRPRPDNHLVWSILNTICCCIPLGIWAIVKSNEVNRFYDAGDYDSAEKAADTASKINTVSAVIAFIGWIVYVILIANGVANDLF